MAKLIYSVKELFQDFLKDSKFVIPEYQRGYKWSKKDVQTLLEDVRSFHDQEDEDIFYCLQNISLVSSRKSLGKTEYRVVDGQQRLTTLSLIMCCFGETGLVKNRLHYCIRPESDDFLNNYVFSDNGVYSFGGNNRENPLKEWDDLSDINTYDFQDIYYLYSAIKTIDDWWRKNAQDRQNLHDKFLNKVKLIVNLTSLDEKQEIELFNNLNGKRVPLDGADLIRAMIVTRKSKNDVIDIKAEVKHDVLLNERRVKIGIQLDQINAWWSNKERQKYFSIFTSQIKSSKQQVEFNEFQYGIDSLYKLYIQTKKGRENLKIDLSKKTIQLSNFEKAEIDELYDNIIELQRLVEYWYEDDDLYHLIQFSAVHMDLNFEEITDLWLNTNRNGFICELKKKIKESAWVKFALRKEMDAPNGGRMVISEDDLNEKEDWHGSEDGADLIKLSILLDVIDIIESRSTKKQNPLARLDADHFKKCSEDMEHIFPQNPLGRDFTKKQLQSYVDHIYNYVKKQGRQDNRKKAMSWIDRNELSLFKDKRKLRVKDYVNGLLGKAMPIGSLGNMCLLEIPLNRSYGNDFFTQKHYDIIIKSQEGHYIRPHVLDAFSKKAADQAKRDDPKYMQQWDRSDIYERRRYLVAQIENFLG